MLRSTLRDKSGKQEFNGVSSFHFHKAKEDEEKENKLGLIKSFALLSAICAQLASFQMVPELMWERSLWDLMDKYLDTAKYVLEHFK